MKVKINIVPDSFDTYPGEAQTELEKLGLTNTYIPYIDNMPIYGDATQEVYEIIRTQSWVESVEIIEGT